MATREKANTHRMTAVIVGVLFIIGTVSGVLSAVVTLPTLEAADYLSEIAANPNRMIMGSLLVLIMAIPLAMVPVVMFPLFREHNEVLALGAVVFRGALEAVCYMGLVIVWLLLVVLGREYAAAGAPDGSYFQTFGVLLLAAGHWTEYLLAIVFSIGALMIYSLFYTSRLLPRWLSIWGFVGGLMYLAVPLVNIFEPQLPSLSVASGAGLLMVPLAVQEMFFALWLIVKGFSPAAFAPESAE
jgi:hypothetical protein